MYIITAAVVLLKLMKLKQTYITQLTHHHLQWFDHELRVQLLELSLLLI